MRYANFYAKNCCIKNCCIFVVVQQAQTFIFNYDTAGNQIERYIVYGRFASESKNNLENETTLKEYDEFKYYPNPVKEELYLEWTNSKEKKIEKIQLFDIQGKIIYQKSTMEEQNTSIPFQSLAKGVYYLQVEYNNRTKKSIKILKD